jgi:hypothetical protein
LAKPSRKIELSLINYRGLGNRVKEKNVKNNDISKKIENAKAHCCRIISAKFPLQTFWNKRSFDATALRVGSHGNAHAIRTATTHYLEAGDFPTRVVRCLVARKGNFPSSISWFV